jgi:hypothetical protein
MKTETDRRTDENRAINDEEHEHEKQKASLITPAQNSPIFRREISTPENKTERD